MGFIKYVISGNIIEVYEYEKFLRGKGNSKGNNNKNNKTSEEVKKNNYNNTNRRRNNLIRRLATLNFNNKYDKFITLTYKENIQDLTYSHEEFKKFIKRLQYRYDKKFKYLSVIEYQDKNGRGAIHYHCLIDLPYIHFSELEKIWGLGMVDIKAISHVDNLGAYLVKYLTKDLNDTRLRGRKAYLCSRNLKRPEEVTNTNLNDFYNKVNKIYYKYDLKAKKPIYETEYLTDKLRFL